MDLCEYNLYSQVHVTTLLTLDSYRHRVPGQPVVCYQRGMHSSLGNMQCTRDPHSDTPSMEETTADSDIV